MAAVTVRVGLWFGVDTTGVFQTLPWLWEGSVPPLSLKVQGVH